MIVLGSLLLTACGPSSNVPVAEYEPVSDSAALETALADGPPMAGLQDDATLLHAFPEASHQQTLADSGLHIALVGDIDPTTFDFNYLEAQWNQMQSCLGITATPPLVVISANAIQPFTVADDVLYHIDGSLSATSSITTAGVIIQVVLADFDGSLGSIGFSFRSITGRFLWLNEGLAERDYPFDCARS
jgi:hypothetical protein